MHKRETEMYFSEIQWFFVEKVLFLPHLQKAQKSRSVFLIQERLRLGELLLIRLLRSLGVVAVRIVRGSGLCGH